MLKRLMNLVLKQKSNTSTSEMSAEEWGNKAHKRNPITTSEMSAEEWGNLFTSNPSEYQNKLREYIKSLRRHYI
jgi:hypothetical protein